MQIVGTQQEPTVMPPSSNKTSKSEETYDLSDPVMCVFSQIRVSTFQIARRDPQTSCWKHLPNPFVMRREGASPSFATPPIPNPSNYLLMFFEHWFSCALLSTFRAFRPTSLIQLIGTAPDTTQPYFLPSMAVHNFLWEFSVKRELLCSCLFKETRQDLFTLVYTRLCVPLVECLMISTISLYCPS